MDNIHPPEQGREPTELEADALAALEDMEQAVKTVDRCKSVLGEIFKKILRKDIFVGATLDTNAHGSSTFQAKVISGTHLQNTSFFRVTGELQILVRPESPVMSRWEVKAKCMRATNTGSPIGAGITLRGYVFQNRVNQHAFMSDNSMKETSENDEVLEEIAKFEKAEYERDAA